MPNVPSLLPFLLLLLTACHTPGRPGARPPSDDGTPSATPAADALRKDFDAALTFETNGRTLPVPMVRVAVGGVRTHFIVDTGASHHVVTNAFAAQAGLTMAKDEDGKDHTGAPISAAHVGDVDVVIGGQSVALHDVKAIQGPPPFVPLGIGGFLSPQHLDAFDVVVIDFVELRLSGLQGGEPSAAWAKRTFGGDDVWPLPRPSHRKLYTTGSVDGSAVGAIQLDTGGSGSEVHASWVAAAASSDLASNGIGVSGRAVEGRRSRGHTLRLGGVTLPLDDILVVDALSDADTKALLGMNVMGTARWVLDQRGAGTLLWIRPSKPTP